MAENYLIKSEELDKVKGLMGFIAGISQQGLAGAGGGEFGQEGLNRVLDRLESPWPLEHLMDQTFQAILKLAGEAWLILQELDGNIMEDSAKGSEPAELTEEEENQSAEEEENPSDTIQAQTETEFDRLLNLAGNMLTIGGQDGFILSQVINALFGLAFERHEKEELGKVVSYFENLVRRRQFHQTIRQDLSGRDWKVNFFPREEEEASGYGS